MRMADVADHLQRPLLWSGLVAVEADELQRDPDAVPPNVASTLIRADTGSNLIAVPCDLVATRLFEGWDETGELRPIDRLEAKGPTQHDQATRRELEKMVQQALALVSPELREAVILRDLQDMDYKEIALVLGIPEGTVKSRISRGSAELARLLERNKKEVM